MKHKFDIKSTVLGGFLGAMIMFSVGAATVGRTAWDYKIIAGRLGKSGHAPLAEQLDQAAAEG